MEKLTFLKNKTPVKIINKLNNMSITISEGKYNTRPGDMVVVNDNLPLLQKFKITQKDKTGLYFIQPMDGIYTLSAKSAFGDALYSQLKLQKYSEDVRQLWRIVPYQQIIQCQKNKTKHSFQYKLTNGSITNQTDHQLFAHKNNNQFKLGYQHPTINTLKLQNKTLEKPTSQLKGVYTLGYEFPSGPHVKAYSKIIDNSSSVSQTHKKSNQLVSHSSNTTNTQQANYKNYSKNPVRFPIRQKSNLLEKDRNNQGWFFIQNVKYNLVLQIYGGIDQNGMSIVLNKPYGNRNQLWKFQ